MNAVPAKAFPAWCEAALTGSPGSSMALRFAAGEEAREQLEEVLETILEGGGYSPSLKARARYVLGVLLRKSGDPKEGSREFSRLSLIDKWQIIGSFDNDQNSGWHKVYPPEETIDLGAKYEGKRWKVGWRPVKYFDFDGSVDLGVLLDPKEWAVGYLASWLNVPAETKAELRLSVGNAVKVWLNGRLILSDDKAKTPAMDQYVVPLVLSKGYNQLLVKVCSRDKA